MELGTYLDLTSFIGEAFQYYRTWQPFTFMFWVGFHLFL